MDKRYQQNIRENGQNGNAIQKISTFQSEVQQASQNNMLQRRPPFVNAAASAAVGQQQSLEELNDLIRIQKKRQENYIQLMEMFRKKNPIVTGQMQFINKEQVVLFSTVRNQEILRIQEENPLIRRFYGMKVDDPRQKMFVTRFCMRVCEIYEQGNMKLKQMTLYDNDKEKQTKKFLENLHRHLQLEVLELEPILNILIRNFIKNINEELERVRQMMTSTCSIMMMNDEMEETTVADYLTLPLPNHPDMQGECRSIIEEEDSISQNNQNNINILSMQNTNGDNNQIQKKKIMQDLKFTMKQQKSFFNFYEKKFFKLYDILTLDKGYTKQQISQLRVGNLDRPFNELVQKNLQIQNSLKDYIDVATAAVSIRNERNKVETQSSPDLLQKQYIQSPKRISKNHQNYIKKLLDTSFFGLEQNPQPSRNKIKRSSNQSEKTLQHQISSLAQIPYSVNILTTQTDIQSHSQNAVNNPEFQQSNTNIQTSTSTTPHINNNNSNNINNNVCANSSQQYLQIKLYSANCLQQNNQNNNSSMGLLLPLKQHQTHNNIHELLLSEPTDIHAATNNYNLKSSEDCSPMDRQHINTDNIGQIQQQRFQAPPCHIQAGNIILGQQRFSNSSENAKSSNQAINSTKNFIVTSQAQQQFIYTNSQFVPNRSGSSAQQAAAIAAASGCLGFNANSGITYTSNNPNSVTSRKIQPRSSPLKNKKVLVKEIEQNFQKDNLQQNIQKPAISTLNNLPGITLNLNAQLQQSNNTNNNNSSASFNILSPIQMKIQQYQKASNYLSNKQTSKNNSIDNLENTLPIDADKSTNKNTALSQNQINEVYPNLNKITKTICEDNLENEETRKASQANVADYCSNQSNQSFQRNKSSPSSNILLKRGVDSEKQSVIISSNNVIRGISSTNENNCERESPSRNRKLVRRASQDKKFTQISPVKQNQNKFDSNSKTLDNAYNSILNENLPFEQKPKQYSQEEFSTNGTAVNRSPTNNAKNDKEEKQNNSLKFIFQQSEEIMIQENLQVKEYPQNILSTNSGNEEERMEQEQIFKKQSNIKDQTKEEEQQFNDACMALDTRKQQQGDAAKNQDQSRILEVEQQQQQQQQYNIINIREQKSQSQSSQSSSNTQTKLIEQKNSSNNNTNQRIIYANPNGNQILKYQQINAGMNHQNNPQNQQQRVKSNQDRIRQSKQQSSNHHYSSSYSSSNHQNQKQNKFDGEENQNDIYDKNFPLNKQQNSKQMSNDIEPSASVDYKNTNQNENITQLPIFSTSSAQQQQNSFNSNTNIEQALLNFKVTQNTFVPSSFKKNTFSTNGNNTMYNQFRQSFNYQNGSNSNNSVNNSSLNNNNNNNNLSNFNNEYNINASVNSAFHRSYYSRAKSSHENNNASSLSQYQGYDQQGQQLPFQINFKAKNSNQPQSYPITAVSASVTTSVTADSTNRNKKKENNNSNNNRHIKISQNNNNNNNNNTSSNIQNNNGINRINSGETNFNGTFSIAITQNNNNNNKQGNQSQDRKELHSMGNLEEVVEQNYKINSVKLHSKFYKTQFKEMMENFHSTTNNSYQQEEKPSPYTYNQIPQNIFQKSSYQNSVQKPSSFDKTSLAFPINPNNYNSSAFSLNGMSNNPYNLSGNSNNNTINTNNTSINNNNMPLPSSKRSNNFMKKAAAKRKEINFPKIINPNQVNYRPSSDQIHKINTENRDKTLKIIEDSSNEQNNSKFISQKGSFDAKNIAQVIHPYSNSQNSQGEVDNQTTQENQNKYLIKGLSATSAIKVTGQCKDKSQSLEKQSYKQKKDQLQNNIEFENSPQRRRSESAESKISNYTTNDQFSNQVHSVQLFKDGQNISLLNSQTEIKRRKQNKGVPKYYNKAASYNYSEKEVLQEFADIKQQVMNTMNNFKQSKQASYDLNVQQAQNRVNENVRTKYLRSSIEERKTEINLKMKKQKHFATQENERDISQLIGTYEQL